MEKYLSLFHLPVRKHTVSTHSPLQLTTSMHKLLIVLVLFLGLGTLGTAETFDDFTYTDNGTSISITGYPKGKTGALVIPDMINGQPVTSIGEGAFANCSGLTSITIPPSVTNIGEGTFVNCRGLISITIPPSVVSIGQNAFVNCSGLVSITIPASVTSIGYAFYGCSELATIVVDAANPNYSSLAGVLFNKLQTVLIESPAGVIGNYTIPTSVTSIGDGAFANCSKLTSVTISASVTSIGAFAFGDCSGLNSVTIPASVTSIAEQAFYGCNRLTNVTIPSSVVSIGNSAFERCSSLNVAIFAGNAPAMGANVFSNSGSPVYGAPQHTTVYRLTTNSGFSSPSWYGYPIFVFDVIGTSGDFTYGIAASQVTIIRYDGPSSRVSIPSTIAGLPVTRIGQRAFADCRGLSGVTIPVSVTSVGAGVFYNCSDLAFIYLKGDAPAPATLDNCVDSPFVYLYYWEGTKSWPSGGLQLLPLALDVPSLTALPAGVSANIGENVTFHAIAKTFFPLTLGYQWQKNGIDIPSATTASLSLSNIQSATTGTYTVVVTNDCGSVASSAALTLTGGGLYTASEYQTALQTGLSVGLQAGMSMGRTQVTDSPNAYGLYSPSQMKTMAIGDLVLSKNSSGTFTLNYDIQQTTDMMNWTIYQAKTQELTGLPADKAFVRLRVK